MKYTLNTRDDVVSYFRESNFFDRIIDALSEKGSTVKGVIEEELKMMVESSEVDIPGELGSEAVIDALFDDFVKQINERPVLIAALAAKDNDSFLLVDQYEDDEGEPVYLVHFNGHFHRVSGESAEDYAGALHDIDRGLYLPSEEFDPAFRSYLDRMEKAGDDYMEIIIPREGWNEMAGAMELIIMFPYSVVGTEGHCHAEIYTGGGFRSNPDGLCLVDYDGVMKRTNAVELTKELCESYGADYDSYVGEGSYKAIRKQRHQEVYDGFAKLAYFGKKWDGYEIVDENKADETYKVNVLVEEHHTYSYDVSVMASSASAARAKVQMMDEQDWIRMSGSGEVHDKTIASKQIVSVNKVQLDEPGSAYDFDAEDHIKDAQHTAEESYEVQAAINGGGAVERWSYVLVTIQNDVVVDRLPARKTYIEAYDLLVDHRDHADEGTSYRLVEILPKGVMIDMESLKIIVIEDNKYNELPYSESEEE